MLSQCRNAAASRLSCWKCRLTGDCDRSAYELPPDQFCGRFSFPLVPIATQPCCCPESAQCVLEIHGCKCRYKNGWLLSNGDNSDYPYSDLRGLDEIIYGCVAIAVLVVVTFICCCYQYYLDSRFPAKPMQRYSVLASSSPNYGSTASTDSVNSDHGSIFQDGQTIDL